MENLETKVQAENSLFASIEIKDYLLETAKWGKILAIVGFVGIGLLLLIALFMMFGMSFMSSMLGLPSYMGFMGFFYIVFGAMYYFPISYLYKFSVKMKQGLLSNELPTVASSFQNLKSLFKFMGILTVVILSIYGLILITVVPTMLFLNS